MPYTRRLSLLIGRSSRFASFVDRRIRPSQNGRCARFVLSHPLLDVCCVDSVRDRKWAIIVSPHQGAIDGPTQPYPTPRRDGRGPHGALLPHRRRLRPSQPPCPLLRIPQAPLGLGSHRPRPFPAAERRGKRTLFLARRREVLLPFVPRGSGAAPFLVPSALEEAQALFGTPAQGHPLRDGRQPGDAARRLDFAFGVAPQTGLSGLGLPGGRVGEVGFVQRLRGEGAPHLRHQWGPSLLRTHPCQRRRRLIDRGAPPRGGFGGWSSEEALGGSGLPKRGVEGCLGRGGHP